MSELTPELIADLALPGEPDISPDGTRVIYTLVPLSKKDEHPTSALWLAMVDGSRPARQFTGGEAEDKSPRWSPDGERIAFLSDRAKRGTAQLYLIAADGGEAVALTSKTNKKSVDSFAWSPGGGQIAFTSADEPSDEDERREKERDDADVYGEHWPYARLRLLSLSSQEVTTLVDGDRHVADFVWSPEGNELTYVLQQNPSLETAAREISIMRTPIAGGEPQLICSFPCMIASLTWSSDGQSLLFLAPTAYKSQSSTAIYAVPAKGGEPRRIACGEENCAGDLQQPRNTPRAVVQVDEGLLSRFYWVDPADGSLAFLSPETIEDRSMAISGWSVQSVEGRGEVVAVVGSTGQQPAELCVQKIEHQQEATSSPIRQLSKHQAAFAGLMFATQEVFTWKAPDGWELDGVLLWPPDAPRDRPLPTVVLVHGGPYSRWRPGFQLSWGNWGQWLALAGYAVLMPNPRGGRGHGERFAAAARGDVGGADYADVMSALDAAIEQGIVDPERVGIGGWSQGGFMTAWAVTQTGRFKAAIMGAGVSDWGMMVMTSDIPDFERELGGSAPWEGVGPHHHATLSPISFVSAVTTPVLILHGEKDERVPLSQAIGFHRALREHHVPTELVVYPREPHGIAERAHQIDLLKRVRRWYDRWLRS